ncbi:MAG TPA: serine hydrolase domain-containing protein [Egibacteraceae bacterium]
MPLDEPTVARVRHRLREAQRRLRLPTLSAAVAVPGAAPLALGIGEPPPAPDLQYRIGSITKTFTAVLVFQQRDAGRLALDDPVGRHLPDTPLGHLRLRDLLGHRSGLRTEPPAPFWEAAPGRSREALLAGLRADDPGEQDRFEAAGPDRFVGTAGDARGERLVVRRDAGGSAVALDLGRELTRRPG